MAGPDPIGSVTLRGKIMAGRTLVIACALVLITGCASMPTSLTTKDLENAPTFTQEEKDAMTEEQKVAVYNESMTEDSNKLICRREHVVGSHFKKTVCKTQAEIELERQSAQDAMMQGRGYGCPAGGPGGPRGVCD